MIHTHRDLVVLLLIQLFQLFCIVHFSYPCLLTLPLFLFNQRTSSFPAIVLSKLKCNCKCSTVKYPVTSNI